MRRKVIRILYGAGVLLALASLIPLVRFASWLFFWSATLTLENTTSEPIREVQVAVWRSEFNLGDLAPGETKRVNIKNYSDSNWRVRGIWPSGEPFEKNFGYITHHMNFSDRLTFHPDQKITFESKHF